MTPAPFTATPPRLVVPVDFSPAAATALRYAAALGGPVSRARLHLLHVLDGGESKAEAHTRLAALSADAGLDDASTPMVVHTRHDGADAADGIAEVAEEIEADVIVTSRTGARGWRQLALGRTTDTLVRTARTPVLILPDAAPPHAEIRVVAVGVDLGGGDAALLAAAHAFAERYGARTPDGTLDVRIVLVHAIAPLPYPASLGGALRDIDPSLHAAIDADVTALARTVTAGGDGIRAEAIVEEGPPAVTLTRVAERIGADVIVVAPATRGAIERWVLGSVAERVIRAATRPVLVVRRKG